MTLGEVVYIPWADADGYGVMHAQFLRTESGVVSVVHAGTVSFMNADQVYKTPDAAREAAKKGHTAEYAAQNVHRKRRAKYE